jgi:hypothetical protein
MARDDEEDVYDEEFDFVDDEEEIADDLDDEASDVETEAPDLSEVAEPAEPTDEPEDEDRDEYRRPKPAADYVVHLYEYKKLARTIDRPFTAEDAEAFASEYNRTSKHYGRFAIAGKNDAKPKKSLE